MGRILYWNALEMSKTKIIKHYEDSISILMWRYIMSETGAHGKMKSTTSSMDNTSAHVLE